MIIHSGNSYYEIIANHKDAFNEEQFTKRYSEVLDRYPFIVGDIGYEQLRLKGFVEDKNKKADISKRFSSIQDYLLEYCNFGCPYFVLRRLPAKEIIKLTAEDVENHPDTLQLETADEISAAHEDTPSLAEAEENKQETQEEQQEVKQEEVEAINENKTHSSERPKKPRHPKKEHSKEQKRQKTEKVEHQNKTLKQFLEP